MPIGVALRRFSSRRFLFGLILLGLVLGFGIPNARAWYELRAGREALSKYRPDEAKEHLARCLKTWPKSIEGHLLASRAARQTGDFDSAAQHIRDCQNQAERTTEAIAFEWALLQAAGGNAREVEEYLQRRIEEEPPLAPLVWEALAEGYIRLYRVLDALACLDYWLKLDPDNLRALELRGLAYQNGKSAIRGSEDFRRVIEKDPERDATRWRLVLCLLEMGSYEEALSHLERIAQKRRNDPDVEVRIARCQNMLGQSQQARQTLDSLLLQHPMHGLALRTRGQLALADQDPEAAEQWLRRAVEVWPNDYQSQWLLGQALQQQQKTTEAKTQLQLAEAIKDQSERLGELRSRKLSEQPLDPVLHYEMGILITRSGHASAGAGWFLSALTLDPDYKPAHAALANYYQAQGDTDRAAEHRKRQ